MLNPMRLLLGMMALAGMAGEQEKMRENLPPVPRYEVHRAVGGIVIDGKLDDAAWKAAPEVEFRFPWDQQTGPKQKTVARLLWDDERLYVGYQCEDTDI